MKYFNGQAMVENKEDFEQNWNANYEFFSHAILYVDELGEITNKNKDQLTFPLYLKYNESRDAHSCGTYQLSTKEDFIAAMQTFVKAKEEELKYYKKFLKDPLNRGEQSAIFWVRDKNLRRNCADLEIVSNTQFQERRQAEIEDMFHNNDEFYEWLTDNFTISELWTVDAYRKNEILEEWLKCCEETFDINNNYCRYEVEV